MTIGGTAGRPAASARPQPRSDAERAEVIRALRRDAADLHRASGPRSLARGLALALPTVLTTYLAVHYGTWGAWVLHVVTATVVLCTLPALYHEATHGNVCRNVALNDTVGMLAAALHGVPFATWRYFHLAHHANTGTDDDSEVYGTVWSRWTLLTFPMTQWAFLVILWRWTIATARGGGPRWVRSGRQRRAVTANAVATVLVWAVQITACVLVPEVLALLILPCALSLMIASLTLVPEHFPAFRIGPGPADQLDRTGSFLSNPLLRVILWNSNFHAAHHFAPKVPAHRLRQLDVMISAVQDPKWRWRGYLHWYGERLRQLSWTPVDLRAAARNDTTLGD
jgi:fatty acid desaturase